ncbi:dihydrolipoyl dehydrogenase family protein [Mycolicibacterium sp. J2]|uniref:dihydrolipoyl dehydrogenase family protein n=1 Tax=Mycolicibacterium sp. J2 TaxID=2993511 RepID=UPI00224AEA21|nr:NAD(P)/FAD-dependent oxidoreductase [Mycolicibacterium sp. J2]MCX2714580.1 NAD(P)/FAD-dependent oxidoreductase [Mycolicibacterium sp. J2]
MTGSFDVAVLGSGPAGVTAAARASELGARTALVTADRFGGMAANDGPVPVRTLAHTARLLRDARQLGRYGIAGISPELDYRHVLARVDEVVDDVRSSSFLLRRLNAQGVSLYENAGVARFVDPCRVRTGSGVTITADKFIVCTGGTGKALPIPGFELTATHSDAWSLTEVPRSMIVIGGGATGLQVASIFNTFGARVTVFEAGPQILPGADRDIAAAVAQGFRQNGIDVWEDFGTIESFTRTDGGIRMDHIGAGTRRSVEADMVISAVGWAADVTELNLGCAGVEVNARGCIEVDRYLRTSNRAFFAAGDVTGRTMLASEAIRDGFIAADNVVAGLRSVATDHYAAEGSFTDPEYASVGLTEHAARASGAAVHCTRLDYSRCTRPIIDGQTYGFCKLVIDTVTAEVLGCHVVGDRAVDIVQVLSVALSSGLRRVDDIARLSVSFPTYGEIVIHSAVLASQELGLDGVPLR